MSTSSGRKDSCQRCGHTMNEHSGIRESECKKCKKVFSICQARVHGRSATGWRICFVPCTCGKEYYPDKANAATSLESWEYVPGHAGYRLPDPATADTTATTDYEPDHTAYAEDDDIAYTADYTEDYQSGSSEDPIANLGTAPNTAVASGSRRKVRHIRVASGSSADPLAGDEFQEMSGLADQLERVDLSGSTAALVYQNQQPEAEGQMPGDNAIEVTALLKDDGYVRYSAQGHDFKSPYSKWQNMGSYFLFVGKGGQEYWTREIQTLPPQTHAPGSSVNPPTGDEGQMPGDNAVEVTALLKDDGYVRYSAQGHDFKSPYSKWQNMGSYFLFVGKGGQEYWTTEIQTLPLQSQASGSSNKGKGKAKK